MVGLLSSSRSFLLIANNFRSRGAHLFDRVFSILRRYVYGENRVRERLYPKS